MLHFHRPQGPQKVYARIRIVLVGRKASEKRRKIFSMLTYRKQKKTMNISFTAQIQNFPKTHY